MSEREWRKKGKCVERGERREGKERGERERGVYLPMQSSYGVCMSCSTETDASGGAAGGKSGRE